jgi:hypothetical protein
MHAVGQIAHISDIGTNPNRLHSWVGVGSLGASWSDRAEEQEAVAMAFDRQQIRESIERAGDAHWQALVRHHTDAYPESNPTPGDVARAEAERLNSLGLGEDPNLRLVESRVEQVPPAVRITHVFEDREKGTTFETEPFTGYE